MMRLDPFPWLLMAVYNTDAKHGLTDVPSSSGPMNVTTDVQEQADASVHAGSDVPIGDDSALVTAV
jgi:hypothetical protein